MVANGLSRPSFRENVKDERRLGKERRLIKSTCMADWENGGPCLLFDLCACSPKAFETMHPIINDLESFVDPLVAI